MLNSSPWAAAVQGSSASSPHHQTALHSNNALKYYNKYRERSALHSESPSSLQGEVSPAVREEAHYRATKSMREQIISIHREEEEEDDEEEADNSGESVERSASRHWGHLRVRGASSSVQQHPTTSPAVDDDVLKLTLPFGEHSCRNAEKASKTNATEYDRECASTTAIMKRVEELSALVESLKLSIVFKDDIIDRYETLMRNLVQSDDDDVEGIALDDVKEEAGARDGTTIRSKKRRSATAVEKDNKTGKRSAVNTVGQRHEEQSMLLDEFKTHLISLREEVVLLRDRLLDWQKKEEKSRHEAWQLRGVLDRIKRSDKSMEEAMFAKVGAAVASASTTVNTADTKQPVFEGDSSVSVLYARLKELQDRLAHACLQKGEQHAQLTSVRKLERIQHQAQMSSLGLQESPNESGGLHHHQFRFRGKVADIQLRMRQQESTIQSLRQAIAEVEVILKEKDQQHRKRLTEENCHQHHHFHQQGDPPQQEEEEDGSFLWQLCRGCGNMQWTSKYCPETGNPHSVKGGPATAITATAATAAAAAISSGKDDGGKDIGVDEPTTSGQVLTVANNLTVRPSLHNEVAKLLEALEAKREENRKLKKLLKAIAKTGKLGIPPPPSSFSAARPSSPCEQEKQDKLEQQRRELLLGIGGEPGGGSSNNKAGEELIGVSRLQLKTLDSRMGALVEENQQLSTRCTELILALAAKDEAFKVSEEKLRSIFITTEEEDEQRAAGVLHSSPPVPNNILQQRQHSHCGEGTNHRQYVSDVAQYQSIRKLQETVETLQEELAGERRHNAELGESLRQSRQDVDLLSS